MNVLKFTDKLDKLIAEYEATNPDMDIVECEIKVAGEWFAWYGEFRKYDRNSQYMSPAVTDRVDFVLEANSKIVKSEDLVPGKYVVVKQLGEGEFDWDVGTVVTLVEHKDDELWSTVETASNYPCKMLYTYLYQLVPFVE